MLTGNPRLSTASSRLERDVVHIAIVISTPPFIRFLRSIREWTERRWRLDGIFSSAAASLVAVEVWAGVIGHCCCTIFTLSRYAETVLTALPRGFFESKSMRRGG